MLVNLGRVTTGRSPKDQKNVMPRFVSAKLIRSVEIDKTPKGQYFVWIDTDNFVLCTEYTTEAAANARAEQIVAAVNLAESVPSGPRLVYVGEMSWHGSSADDDMFEQLHVDAALVRMVGLHGTGENTSVFVSMSDSDKVAESKRMPYAEAVLRRNLLVQAVDANQSTKGEQP